MFKLRSALAGLSWLLVPCLAIGAESLAPLAPGEYLTQGGWGILNVSKNPSSARSFVISSNGANGHTCSVRGTIVEGNRGVPEAMIPETDCEIVFRAKTGTIEVTTNGAPSCRYFCGARAGFTGQYFRPATGCGTGQRLRTHAEFERLYKAGSYSDALAALEPLVERCGAVLDWREKYQGLNDLAITQHHLGRGAACIQTLQPLAAEAAVSDETLRERYPPADYERMQKFVNWTRTNLALCGRDR